MSPRSQVVITCCLFIVCVVSTKTTAEQTPKLASEAFALLKERCLRCHGENGIAVKSIYVLDRTRLLKDKTVVPGDAKSLLLRVVESGAMPLGGEKLAEREIQLLRDWVKSGAPDWETTSAATSRKFLTEQQIVRLIEQDLQTASETDRPFLRYYSIAHLYNAGAPEAELEGYRLGLSKLLNSLSWHPSISKAVPIDPARTILRIDLRQYLWTTETWKTILSEYPYGIRIPDADRITRLSGVTLPYVRADWFVATASVPPLYHDIHKLPLTVKELEAGLGVNGVVSKPDGEIVRGGVRSSGVSKNNRIVERHSTRFGAYWKSFDFSGNQGEQNIFKDPLEFKAAGGEMIFNLPNGMQAYFLANAAGKRLDTAPIEIVADRNYPDNPVVSNGRSCMSCHYTGMKTFKDDVRPYVESQTSLPFDRERALSLYRPQHELDGFFAGDTNRFRVAVEEAGGKLSVDFRTEPINALARKFDAELSLAQAAAELGLEPAAFQTKLAKNPRLVSLGFAQLLDTVKGAIKRDAWDEHFHELVRELNVGEFVRDVRSLVAAADRLRGLHKITEAESLLRRAMDLDPKDASAVNDLAVLYVNEKKDYAEAARLFRKAMDLDPKDSTPVSNLAVEYHRSGDLSESIRLYRRAMELNPKNAYSVQGLGRLYYHALGNYIEAERLFRRAVALTPADATVVTDLARVVFKRKDYVEAERLCLKAMELDPKNAEPVNILAEIHHIRGDNTTAERLWRRAMELNPRYMDPVYNLAAMFLARGDYIEGERLCRIATELEPKNGELHADLAGCLLNLKRTDEALAEARRAIALGFKGPHRVFDALGLKP